MGASFGEVEDTVNAYLTALNSYDVDTAWDLMSPELRGWYGAKEDFNSSIIQGFEQSDWHAEIQSISSRSIKTEAGRTTARFVMRLEITEAGFGTYEDTYTFKLVKLQDQWKIDDWRVGVWD